MMAGKSGKYSKYGAYAGAISLILWIITAFFLYIDYPIPIEIVTDEVCDKKGDCSYDVDAIKLAVTLGRLDIVSLVLGLLAIGLGFFALFTFVALKEDAKRIAEDTTHEIIDDEVEKAWALKRPEIEKLISDALTEDRELTKSSVTSKPETSQAKEIGGE